MTVPPSEIQIIKASYALQHRVGPGPLDPALVERCQQAIDRNEIDFVPLARDFLGQLERGLKLARDDHQPVAIRLEALSRPVMELKANGRMFQYDMISGLAQIMLGFLEAVKTIDRDVIEIVAAHHRTLATILERRMTGSGGPYGQLLEQELKDACVRYLARRRAAGPA